MTVTWWRRACFELAWRRGGSGSGLGRSLDEVRSMPLDQIQWELDELKRRWDQESKAFKAK